MLVSQKIGPQALTTVPATESREEMIVAELSIFFDDVMNTMFSRT